MSLREFHQWKKRLDDLTAKGQLDTKAGQAVQDRVEKIWGGLPQEYRDQIEGKNSETRGRPPKPAEEKRHRFVAWLPLWALNIINEEAEDFDNFGDWMLDRLKLKRGNDGE